MNRPIFAAALTLLAALAHAAPPSCESEPQLRLDRISERVILVGETF